MISEPSAHYRNFDSGDDDGIAEKGSKPKRNCQNDDDHYSDEEARDTKAEVVNRHADKNENGSVYLMDIYKTKQRHGYLAILFSLAQTGVLITMVAQCGVAPMNINPMIGPYPDALSYWGSTNSALIIEDGEKWRLLSPIMLHAGILHLFGNVAVQLDAGAFFEQEWGSAAWAIVYLTGAIGASMASTITKPDSISVGSSGAVMALFGAKMSEVFCRCCESRKSVEGLVGHEMRKHQCVATVGGVILVMLMSFVPYVDWGAHLGGLIAGVAVGILIFSCYVKTLVFRLCLFVVGVICTAVGFAETAKYLFNEVEPVEELRDVCEYYQQFFDDFECSCRKET